MSVVRVVEDVDVVVSVRDKVNEILFEIELHSLLACLEAANLGSGKAIEEKALRSKSKESGATENVHNCLMHGHSSFGRSLWPGLSLWICGVRGLRLRCSH